MVVFLYIFWSFIIDQSFVGFREDFSKQSKALKSKIEETKLKINEASDIVKSNPKQGLSQQVDGAKKTSAELDKKIHDRTARMVSPKDMNSILEQVIQKSDGLIVLKMESLGKKILVQKKTEGTQSGNGQSDSLKNDSFQKDDTIGRSTQKGNLSIFEHGLSIELSGGYFETLDFLKSLEKRHLSVVWDEIDYDVVKYPQAEIKIVMHTLSLDEDWIGV
ncbi:MAG: hypothetical protein KA508_01005 [Gammaproteobacteria bacterium]|nr:hypothetical protein [Gammaproteobacteria bacterium]